MMTGIPNQDLLRYQNHRCFFCNTPLSASPYTKRRQTGYTKDHLRPKSQGYTLLQNKVLSCFACNSEKADREPTDVEIEKLRQIQIAHSSKLQTEEYLRVCEKHTKAARKREKKRNKPEENTRSRKAPRHILEFKKHSYLGNSLSEINSYSGSF